MLEVHRLETLVDIMRVPAYGDPSTAVISVGDCAPIHVECDVLVVGGGVGGVAAAVAAARHGARVCILEETDWFGGQLSSQGVSALDEHPHIEYFGGTKSYYALRRSLREHYMRIASSPTSSTELNPGNCWVSKLAFEPKIGALKCKEMVERSGNVESYLRCKMAGVAVDNDRIVSVLAISLDDDRAWTFAPKIVLDATELGDVLPLAQADYALGAETVAQTTEPHAQPATAMPQCVQSLTYPCILERRPPGERHGVLRPDNYEKFKTSQPYSLKIDVHGGEVYSETSGSLAYDVFRSMPGTKGSLWTYRRLIDAGQFSRTHSNDISLINWPGNDYREESVIDRSSNELASALQEAKQVSLGFLHWLQTEAPADTRPTGAPQLMLHPEAMGTADGLSKHPYIRESRRIKALKTIVEQDVSTQFQAGPRAAFFRDSVGVGWYPIDIHRVAGDVGVSCRTHPFQIPMGALIPKTVCNLLAAAKNIGTTHISNGCYRLHPVEWNIGESAGALAAFAIQRGCSPKMVYQDSTLSKAFQETLLADGVPLAWATDVPVDNPLFVAVQKLLMANLLPADSPLEFRPEAPISIEDWQAWGGTGPVPRSRGAACMALFGAR